MQFKFLSSFSLQFSKEKYILDSSPEKLHKELEEELKLSSTDLRSHAWYHGRIPREVWRQLGEVWADSPVPCETGRWGLGQRKKHYLSLASFLALGSCLAPNQTRSSSTSSRSAQAGGGSPRSHIRLSSFTAPSI